MGEQFNLFVLATRDKQGKGLKRVFNLCPEGMYRFDGQTGLPIFALAAVDSDNSKLHLF